MELASFVSLLSIVFGQRFYLKPNEAPIPSQLRMLVRLSGLSAVNKFLLRNKSAENVQKVSVIIVILCDSICGTIQDN